MYSLALVLWEIGNCCCSITHIRPYENQLPCGFNVDHLIELVCVEQKRPLSCIATSDPVRMFRHRRIECHLVVLLSIRFLHHFSIC